MRGVVISTSLTPTLSRESGRGGLRSLDMRERIAERSRGKSEPKREELVTPTAFSYVSGVSEEPLLGSTIGQALASAAERWPERPALISPSHGVAWTWQELRARVRDLAAGLLALGLKRGERIGVWSLNRPEWTLTQFAAAEAGLVFVTINPAYRLHELEYALRKVGCAALVVATRFKTSDFIGMVNALAPELASAKPGALKAQKLPDLRIVAQIGETRRGNAGLRGGRADGGRGRTRGAGGDARRNSVRRRRQHPVHVGTTGSPKGVTLSHHNILNNGYFTGRAMRLTPEDRICIPVPLYHCFGMVMGNLAAVTLGAAMVYPGEGFDPLATLKTVESERCTALYGVPTMFIAELDHPEFGSFDLSSLAHGHHGGRALPDRGDAESDRAHAHARRDDRLWHDGDEPGQLPEFDRGYDRAPRLDDRPRASPCRGEGDRPTGPHRSARGARANSARAAIP